MKRWLRFCLAFTLVLLPGGEIHASNLKLWYTAPGANNMTQGLLIGNGRMGAVIPGGIATDTIILNEDSLWAGTANLSGGYSLGATASFGNYQMFGSLVLNLPSHTNVTGYVRALDIGTGIATMDYTNNGVAYHRELICSAPDQVLAIQLTANANAAYTGSVQLNDARSATTLNTTNGSMFSSALANGEQYEAQLIVTNTGGTVVYSGGAVNFTNCNSLTILVALGTSYVMDYSRNYQGNNPHSNVVAQVAAATAKGFPALEMAHTNDFENLFNRVSIWLGDASSARTNLPTDQRITANAASDDDPWMEQLMYQYGRYLMISSSRGSVPMNLAGLWNDNNNPSWSDWGDDYHSDINVEMMYWEAEVANLPECFLPFSNWLQSQIPAWRYVTTNTSGSLNNSGYGGGFGGTNGWTTRTSHNLYGGQGWNWIQSGNAWYCMHLWEHYAFGGDTNYLLTIYPILRETCQFWQQHLQPFGANTNGLPVTTLIATNGWSPEHGPWQNGVSFDQELIWDIFNNYQQACSILNTDAVYCATVSNLQANLLVPGIGPWGELREWLYYPDSQTDTHRHTMHLVGVYPGHQFTPDQTPALLAAAKVGLLARGDTGDSASEWAHAWRISLFARMLDPADAHHKLALYCGAIYPNLIGNLNSIAQWDGSCGVTAGITEMLLQSHEGRIALLPSLPTNWPAGSVSGLRARGGFTVDMAWTNGWLTTATIHGAGGTSCAIQYGSQVLHTNIPPGNALQFTPLIPPNAPSGVLAHPGNAQATVNWNLTGGATGYCLKRSITSGGGYTTIASLSQSSMQITGLVNGTTYYFVVSATNSFGESANSTEVSVTPQAGYATNCLWTGAVNNSWDVATTNWQMNGSASLFQDGSAVVFDDTAAGNTSINLPVTRTPASVLVNNSALYYAISGGAISGSGSLVKSGSGTLTLSGANTFTGGATNNGGTIITAVSTTGSAGNINSGPLGAGTLTLAGGSLSGDNGAVRTNANAIVIAAGTTNTLGSSSAGKNFFLTGALSGGGLLQNQSATPAASYSFFLLGDMSQFTGTMVYNGVSSGNGANWRVGTSGSIVNLSQASVMLNGGNGKNFGYVDGSSNVMLDLGSLSGNGYFQGSYAGGTGNILVTGFLNTNALFSGQMGVSGANMANFSLVKVGTGTQILSGASLYTGSTTVSNGELVVSTIFSGGGNVFVNGGATFGVTNTSAASAAIVSNLTIAANGTFEFQNIASSTMPLIIASNVMFSGACSIKIAGANGLMAVSSFPLVSYSGVLSGFGNVPLQMPYGWRAALATNATQIILTNVIAIATTPPSLSFGFSNSQLQAGWPADHTGWRLQSQTNLGDPDWQDVAGSGATNYVAVMPTNHNLFFRLIYP